MGGLHYSNTGVPYNGRPWPASVHLCVCVWDSHVLAHIPIRGHTHAHTGELHYSQQIIFFIYGEFADAKSDLALRSLATICNTELNTRFRRQSFWAPNRSELNFSTGVGVQSWILGRKVMFRSKKSLVTHLTFYTPGGVWVNQWPSVCGCCPASIHRTSISSFPTCTTIWGFKQALKQNLVLWENHVQVNLSSLVQEKLAPVPKEVALRCSNHLKAVLNREETSVCRRCYESRPN